MKKKILFGLMAMLLPLATWAQSTSPLSISAESVVYDGNGTTPSVTVKFGSGTTQKSLTENDDYVLTYEKDGKTDVSVRDAGTYTVTAKGKPGTAYEYYDAVTTTFEVTKKKLTGLTLQAGEKTYGATDEKVDLSQFVSAIDGLASDNGEVEADEKANALKCLYLYRIDEEDAKEVANQTYKVLVRGYKEDVATGSNYYYVENDKIDAVDMKITPKELTVKISGGSEYYNGQVQTVTAIIDESEIVVYNGVKDDVAVSFSENVAGENKDNKELKNADTYTLTAELTGNDSKNYTLANNGEVSYEIKRATLTIEPNEKNSLTIPYSGTEEKGADLTSLYKFTPNPATGEDVTDEDHGLKMILTGTAQSDGTLPNVGEYLVNPTVKGTTLWNDQYPTGLPNYEIVYKRDENKYKIEPKTVKYYFTSEGKIYDGLAVESLEADKDYKVVIDLENGFVGETDTWKKEPTAKFVEEEVKNAKTYNLTTDEAGTESTGNYKFELLSAADKNIYVIEPRELTIIVNDQQIAFGTTQEQIDEYLKQWATWNGGDGKGTDISNFTKGNDNSGLAADRTAIREMYTLSLDETVNIKESGEYKEGIVLTFNDDLDEAALAILNNYGGKGKIDATKGTLTVNGVSETLVLDGSEIAEEVEEGEETIMDKLTRLNGANVTSVTVKRLTNFTVDGGFETNNSIKAEKWYTLVLPFDVTVRELSEKFGYAVVNIPKTENTDASKIRFKLTMQTVPANTLMLFKVDQDMDWDNETGVTFGSATDPKKIVAPTNEYSVENGNADIAGNKFIGIYEKTTITGEQDWYMYPFANTFSDAASVYGYNGVGFEVYPLNGYVHFEDATVPASARSIIIENGDGSTTAINAVSNVITRTSEGWYTIGGVKLDAEPTQKGVYINNGKKVVIK